MLVLLTISTKYKKCLIMKLIFCTWMFYSDIHNLPVSLLEFSWCLYTSLSVCFVEFNGWLIDEDTDWMYYVCSLVQIGKGRFFFLKNDLPSDQEIHEFNLSYEGAMMKMSFWTFTQRTLISSTSFDMSWRN